MIQIIQQTRDEKMAMYMKLPKKQIAEMLINCNEIIDSLQTSSILNGEIRESGEICVHNWKEWEDENCNAQMRCTICKQIKQI